MSAECCGTNSSRGWLDWAAIGMSVVCGVHCLITPILLISLPILGRSFWVDENFHLWMIALVVPTTTLAVLSGCRRHKDRWVALFSVIGILLLATSVWMDASQHVEFAEHAEGGPVAAECEEGASCCAAPASMADAGSAFASFSSNQLINVMGGLFLVIGHFRNFRLCRKDRCSHGLD